MQRMTTALPQPWLEDALEQLDLRRHDRCMVLTCPTKAHIAAVAKIVGRTARILVVEPDRKLAESAARFRHEGLEVIIHEPEPGERLGTFDALLACPLTTRGWPLSYWHQVIASNLRPGGRFVLDLPAQNFCDPITRAWGAIGGAPQVLAPLQGPSEPSAAGDLRSDLRSVEASMGTHLVHLESPYILGQLVRQHGDWQGEPPDLDRIEDLDRALVADQQTNGVIDIVLHRTRVHGLR